LFKGCVIFGSNTNSFPDANNCPWFTKKEISDLSELVTCSRCGKVVPSSQVMIDVGNDHVHVCKKCVDKDYAETPVLYKEHLNDPDDMHDALRRATENLKSAVARAIPRSRGGR
jgi:transcription elongation factor Elf1